MNKKHLQLALALATGLLATAQSVENAGLEFQASPQNGQIMLVGYTDQLPQEVVVGAYADINGNAEPVMMIKSDALKYNQNKTAIPAGHVKSVTFAAAEEALSLGVTCIGGWTDLRVIDFHRNITAVDNAVIQPMPSLEKVILRSSEMMSCSNYPDPEQSMPGVTLYVHPDLLEAYCTLAAKTTETGMNYKEQSLYRFVKQFGTITSTDELGAGMGYELHLLCGHRRMTLYDSRPGHTITFTSESGASIVSVTLTTPDGQATPLAIDHTGRVNLPDYAPGSTLTVVYDKDTAKP